MAITFDYARLKRERRALGFTQEQLAVKAGVSTWTLGQWEAGLMYPTAERVAAVAAALELTTGDLWVGEPSTLGEQRILSGITQRSLAKLLRIPRATVAAIETGRLKLTEPLLSEWAEQIGVAEGSLASRPAPQPAS